MTDAPAAPGRNKIFLRLGLLALVAVSGFLALRFTPLGEFMDKDRLLALFGQLRAEWWSPLLLILLFCVAAPIGLPASPILLAGGMVFGFALGSFYNMAGLVGGAMLSYWVGRALGREAIVQLAGPRLKKAEKLFERRGFLPLIQARLLPIPFSVVCYGAALAGVPVGRYFVTSLIGIAPATLMHTYFAPKTIHEAIDGQKPIGLLAAYAGCWIGLNIVAGWPQIQDRRRRRRRLEEIRALRTARPSKA
jgi:phospholipase D1/2